MDGRATGVTALREQLLAPGLHALRELRALRAKPSLSLFAISAHLRGKTSWLTPGAGGGIRTRDLLITNLAIRLSTRVRQCPQLSPCATRN